MQGGRDSSGAEHPAWDSNQLPWPRPPARVRLAQAVDSALATLVDTTQTEAQLQADTEFWTGNEGLSSELRFQNRLALSAAEVHFAYKNNQIADMRSAFQRLIWPIEHLIEEPLLSIFDSAITQSAFYASQALSDRFLLDACYLVCENSCDVLTDKRVRRNLLSLPYRPDSESWLRLFISLASLKWKGTDKQRDLVFSVEDIVSAYCRTASTMLINLEQIPSQQRDRNRLAQELIGWCGLEVLKMCLRWSPLNTNDLITYLNTILGEIFSPQPGHFMRGRFPREHAKLYWDFELFKWCVTGPGTQDEALLCYQWRLDSVRAGNTDNEEYSAFILGAQRELEFLLDLGSQRMEVAGG